MVRQHAAGPSIMGRPRKAPWYVQSSRHLQLKYSSNCVALRIVCDGKASEPCSRCLASGLVCKVVRSTSSPTPIPQPPVIPGPSTWNREPSGPDTAGALPYVRSNLAALNLDVPFPADLSLLATTASTNEASTSEDWFQLFGMDPAAVPDIDWNLLHTEDNMFLDFNAGLNQSPSWAFPPPLQANTTLLPVTQTHQSPEDLHGAPSEIPDGQPFDSPWVSCAGKVS